MITAPEPAREPSHGFMAVTGTNAGIYAFDLSTSSLTLSSRLATPGRTIEINLLETLRAPRQAYYLSARSFLVTDGPCRRRKRSAGLQTV